MWKEKCPLEQSYNIQFMLSPHTCVADVDAGLEPITAATGSEACWVDWFFFILFRFILVFIAFTYSRKAGRGHKGDTAGGTRTRTPAVTFISLRFDRFLFIFVCFIHTASLIFVGLRHKKCVFVSFLSCWLFYSLTFDKIFFLLSPAVGVRQHFLSHPINRRAKQKWPSVSVYAPDCSCPHAAVTLFNYI